MDDANWIIESTQGNGSAHMFKVEKTIISTKSRFQKIDIVYLTKYGKTLFLDCKLQSSQADEYIYHETLVHPAMLMHENPENVLIIGGGEGATLREVLKYDNVNVKMVELDKDLTELCIEYLPEWHQESFSNPRAEIIYGDGKAYLENTKEKFDIIISDLTAPTAGSYPLFTKQFFETIKKHLEHGGIFVLQADSTSLIDRKVFTSICYTLGKVFAFVKPLQTYIPSYDTSWGFIITSDRDYKHDEKIKERSMKIDTKFYDAHMHENLFTLSKDLRHDIKNETSVYDENTQ